MKPWILLPAALLGCVLFVSAQQMDVPEPTFMQMPGVQAYQPRFKGRDPFYILTAALKTAKVSILELEYHGVLQLGGNSIAIFNWRGDTSVRYVLKQRKLYNAAGDPVDGVVGDITDMEVVLNQGNMKIPFPRDQRRP